MMNLLMSSGISPQVYNSFITFMISTIPKLSKAESTSIAIPPGNNVWFFFVFPMSILLWAFFYIFGNLHILIVRFCFHSQEDTFSNAPRLHRFHRFILSIEIRMIINSVRWNVRSIERLTLPRVWVSIKIP